MKNRIVSLILAALMTCSLMCSPAFALEHPIDELNYIYADSINDIDWDTLSATDVVIVPNTGNNTVSTASQQLTETPEYLSNSPIETATPYGFSPPNIMTVWNVVEKGLYEIKGATSSWSDTALYTNTYFTGADQYWVVINNNLNNAALTASFHGWVYTYRTIEIPAGSSCYTLFDSDHANHDVSASTDWYIKFANPDPDSNACDVDGYVKEY